MSNAVMGLAGNPEHEDDGEFNLTLRMTEEQALHLVCSLFPMLPGKIERAAETITVLTDRCARLAAYARAMEAVMLATESGKPGSAAEITRQWKRAREKFGVLSREDLAG